MSDAPDSAGTDEAGLVIQFAPGEPTGVEPCGCSIAGRCDRHAAMMSEIYAVWNGSNDPDVLATLWSLSDGYGPAGFVPPQGHDWSGIRDSSVAAVEAMHAAIHA